MVGLDRNGVKSGLTSYPKIFFFTLPHTPNLTSIARTMCQTKSPCLVHHEDGGYIVLLNRAVSANDMASPESEN